MPLTHTTPRVDNPQPAPRDGGGFTSPCNIIGVASAIGAPDKGCAAGPDYLQRHGLVARLAHHGIAARWLETIRPPDVRTTYSTVDALQRIGQRIAARIADSICRNEFFVVLGGDHSCAIGTWSGACAAMAPRGPLGLIWIDAHMDAHTPDSTPSGAYHGMPLACLLGHGEPALTDLTPQRPLSPEHLCLIGVHSYEDEEQRLLQDLGVRVMQMEEIRRRGLPAVIREAGAIAAGGTAGYGVSLDLDAIDPRDAPGVGSPEAGGLAATELISALCSHLPAPGLLGFEIAEYNPLRDSDARTAVVVESLLTNLLRTVKEDTHARHY